MLMIATALYCEAKPFIDYFQMKKDTSISKFQVFKKEDIILIITKTGAMNAAIAVTYLCTLFPPKSTDLFINIGICGYKAFQAFNKTCGTLFLCNKIIDYLTKRSYYPDMLYQHPFKEITVVTHHQVITYKQDSNDNNQPLLNNLSKDNKSFIGVTKDYLIDMEASGIYPAAITFFQPHQIFFLKVVSDFLTGDFISPEQVTNLIQGNLPDIINWLSPIQEQISKIISMFTDEEEKCLYRIAEDLKLSTTMDNQLRQIMRYYKLQYGDFIHQANEFLDNVPKPCQSKYEGKKYFEQLKQRFI